MLKFQRSQDLDELILLAHVKPSVAYFFIFASVRGSMVNLITYLIDQLTRRFQSADDQF
jgi:hypothetical protein